MSEVYTNPRFYLEDETIFHVEVDGVRKAIPAEPKNRDYNRFLKAGLAIAPYVAPPPLTTDDRIDVIVGSVQDLPKLLLQCIFLLKNEINAINNDPPITKPQFRNWLKGKLS